MNPARLRGHGRHVRSHLDQRVHKARRQNAGIRAGFLLLRQQTDRLAPVKAQQAVGLLDDRRIEARILPGRRLQQDGRLPLIAAALPDAEDGSGAVEQAPHAGGERAIQPRLPQAGQLFGIPDPVGRAAGLTQQGKGHAVRLFHGPVPARQRDGTQAAEAAEITVIPCQQLAAPACAVRPEAGPVPDEAEAGSFQAVVGHAGGHMGMVMLHLQQRDALLLCPILRIAGREIIRMQVAGQRAGPDVKEPLKMADLLFIVFQGLEILQVADVLAQEGVSALAEAEAGLLLGPAGEDLRFLLRHGQRLGHIAARAAGKILLSVQHPAQRIVTARLNPAVVHQKTVRDAPEGFQRFRVVPDDRRIGEVRTGHDQHVGPVFKQQHVQRCIGQHHPEPAVLAQVFQARLLLLQQDDGLPGAGEDPLLRSRYFADAFHRGKIPAHDGKGLLVPLLSPAQTYGDRRILAAAGQVKAAEALAGKDFPLLQRRPGKLRRIPRSRLPGGIIKLQRGSADRAAVRLGVVAPVSDVVILAVTVRAHREGLH